MTNTAFNLLQPYLQRAAGKCLWIADENLLNRQSSPNEAITVIVNRQDLYEQLKQQHWNARFSDFDFHGFEDQSVDQVFYRVSKEKPVVHHVINEAFRILKTGGQLVLSGDKGEGIKSYIDKAKKLFAGQCQANKAEADTWLAELTRPDEAGSKCLDDKDYRKLRPEVADEHFEYWSKPGVYGWNKIDKGSAYLIEHLDQFLMVMPEPPKQMLDLGCGYGYLSLNASEMDIPVTATDNNAAAIAACERNFARYPINGQVITADCARGITQKFDLILCNPPFHAGFDVETDLTDRFLKAAHDRLSDKGIACFVTNLHIPLERKAQGLFRQVEIIASNGNFKLTRLSHGL
ncbi:MAG: methyltransferase [Pontibacterium sp.]